jgi:hypothetical protein
MTNDNQWDDTSRQNARESITRYIQGSLRLAKLQHEEIITNAFEIYVMDECPESEQAVFQNFARTELARLDHELGIEKVTWPAITDCDRLDAVQQSLLENNIVFWQASPCCDSCTMGEFEDRIKLLENHCPGIDDRIRGYAFFIDQNLPEYLSKSSTMAVYLAYGWISFDRNPVDEVTYNNKAIEIAHEVCDALNVEGFVTNWNGELSNKIMLRLNWQRRTLLK